MVYHTGCFTFDHFPLVSTRKLCHRDFSFSHQLTTRAAPVLMWVNERSTLGKTATDSGDFTIYLLLHVTAASHTGELSPFTLVTLHLHQLLVCRVESKRWPNLVFDLSLSNVSTLFFTKHTWIKNKANFPNLFWKRADIHTNLNWLTLCTNHILPMQWSVEAAGSVPRLSDTVTVPFFKQWIDHRDHSKGLVETSDNVNCKTGN